MKKRYALVSLVGILILALVGCGSNEGDTALNEDNKPIDESENEEVLVEDEDEMDLEEAKSSQPILAIGGQMPDFIVEGQDGKEIPLLNLDGEEVSIEDYRGKIVLVNFWATWCVYCDAEMPDFEKLLDLYEDVEVLAVNVMEEEGEVRDYIESHNYDFPVILDPDGKLARDFMVQGFPATYFVDEDGIFKGAFPSMMTFEQMEEIVNDIRDKKL